MNGDIYSQIPAPGLVADGILIIHFLIVAFVVFGQALILAGWYYKWEWVRNFWFRLTHLATIGFVVVQTWLGQLCPLTIWEQRLRLVAGQPVFEESFIQHWLSQVLFFELDWWVFVVLYTAFAAIVVWSWWKYPPVRQRD